MSKKKEIHYAYELDCDLSYPKQREGRKSPNPIIAFIDWLHHWDSYPAIPFWLSFANIPFTLILCICLPIAYNDTSYVVLGLGVGVVNHCMLMLMPFLMWPYRHFRHKYFKKHNLPGPYGWGTLDKCSFCHY